MASLEKMPVALVLCRPSSCADDPRDGTTVMEQVVVCRFAISVKDVRHRATTRIPNSSSALIEEYSSVPIVEAVSRSTLWTNNNSDDTPDNPIAGIMWAT